MIFNFYEIKVMIIVVKKNLKKMLNVFILFWLKVRIEKRMSVVGKVKNDENVNILIRFWFIILSFDILFFLLSWWDWYWLIVWVY